MIEGEHLCIGSLCERIYGRNWRVQFQQQGRIRSEELLAPLIRECGSVEAQRVLPDLMRYLREECSGSVIDLPSPVMSRLKRPAARLNESSARDLRHLIALEVAFLGVLETSAFDAADLLPLILFSALRFGGCANPKKLQALMLALRDLPKRHQHHIWFELECEDASAPVVWRPDVLTLALLAKWYAAGHHEHWASGLPVAPNFHREIARLFRANGVWGPYGLPVTRLLNAVSTRLSLDVSPILADCCRGVIDNRPLNPAAFYRYIVGKSPRLARHEKQINRTADPTSRRNLRSIPLAQLNVDTQIDNDFWEDARRTLRTENNRSKARDLITTQLELVRQHILPISALVADWVILLLSTHNHWGNRLKPSSVGTQLSSILAGLRLGVGLSNAVAFSGSEWGEVYGQILEDKASTGSRHATQKTLAEFHQFLVSHHGVSETEAVTPGLKRTDSAPHVDANLLLEEEFKAVCGHFQRERERARDARSWCLHTCQLMVAILGYRCGLRRSEAYWLRICDIELGSRAELLLTGKRAVTLKTVAGYRRIPIYLLTTPNEMGVVREWVAWRTDSGAGQGDYLLSLEEDNRLLVESSELFDPVQSAMQVITGDPGSRFHHLRHSFATTNFYHWMRPDLAGADAYRRVCLQRERILDAHHGTAPSRKVAKALHVMIGHASVDMTMTHYVHSAEWLLYEELNRISPRLSTDALAHISGLTRRQVQRLSNGQGANATSIRAHSSRILQGLIPGLDTSTWQSPLEKRVQNQNGQIVRERVWVLDLWQAILVYCTHTTPVLELAERFNLKPKMLENALERLKKILGMKYGTAGHHYYRHRLPEWAAYTGMLFMFRFPRQKRHLELVVEIIERFSALSKRQKPMVLWAVEYFLENGSARNAYITFREKRPLKKFIRVLEILGLSAEVPCSGGKITIPRYQLRLVMPAAAGSSERGAAWSFWSRGLQLHAFQMLDGQSRSAGKFGRIELSVLALKGESTRMIRSGRRHRQPSDWGFRLSMYVLAIAYGWSRGNDRSTMEGKGDRERRGARMTKLKRHTEHELLNGLDAEGAHADELADLSDAELGDDPLHKLSGSVKKYIEPLKPVGEDDWESNAL